MKACVRESVSGSQLTLSTSSTVMTGLTSGSLVDSGFGSINTWVCREQQDQRTELKKCS